MRTGIIGERIALLRKEKGISQAELAEVLGIQKSSMSYFENGTRIPKIETIVDICDYFNVSAEYLLGRTNVKNPDIEIRSICEKTGLSERALDEIIRNSNYEDTDLVSLGVDDFLMDNITNKTLENSSFWMLLDSIIMFLHSSKEKKDCQDQLISLLENMEIGNLDAVKETEVLAINSITTILDNFDLRLFRCEQRLRSFIYDLQIVFDVRPDETVNIIKLEKLINSWLDKNGLELVMPLKIKKAGDPDGNDQEEK